MRHRTGFNTAIALTLTLSLQGEGIRSLPLEGGSPSLDSMKGGK